MGGAGDVRPAAEVNEVADAIKRQFGAVKFLNDRPLKRIFFKQLQSNWAISGRHSLLTLCGDLQPLELKALFDQAAKLRLLQGLSLSEEGGGG